MDQNDFEKIIGQLFAMMSRAGLEREALVVLARLMQTRLHDKRDLPCSQPLEVMMRAVTAVIEGDPNGGSYVAEKLKHANKTLLEELPKLMPGFAEAMKGE